MDFITLNDVYRPNKLIEKWESLIWTERFRNAGDFSLKTYLIADGMTDMPLGSCVSLMDTQEVCMVETHEIEKDGKGDDMLTVSGRSIETFFENRITIVSGTPIKNATSGDTNATEVNDQVAAYAATRVLYNARTNQLDANEVIPNFNETISDDASSVGDNADRQIARADSYSELMKLLEEENTGIRNQRPLAASTSTLVTNVYKYWSGVSVLPQMCLDVQSGHFTGPVRYTWSIKDMKTAVYVASQFQFIKVFASGQSGNTGLDHRVALIDATDITKNTTKVPGMLKARGKSYLNQHKKTFSFDGKVSPDIPYIYNKDYGLGDRFKIKGDYGAEDTVQVVEYIRSQDKNGEVGYPNYVT
jgi:hypothetical protein